MGLRALWLVVGAAAAFQAPPVAFRAAVALRGKTRGDGGAGPPEEPAAAASVDEAVEDAAGGRKEAADMRVGELTAELDLRGVDYSDCVEADELRARLRDARSRGVAAPDLVDRFNRQRAERMADPDAPNPMNLSEEEIASIKNADGTLPGGLKPDEIFKLMNDPAVATMLANPKFQDILKDTMGGGGPDALAKHMADPESRDMLLTLTNKLKDAGMVPPQVK